MPTVASSKIFAVLGPPDDPILTNAVQSTFPEDHIEIRPGQWFIAAQGTAQEISNRLNITSPNSVVKSAVIVGVSGYFGRAKAPVWEWIAAKMESAGNG
jgi:hypothetical protein